MDFERKTLGEISINGKGEYGIAAPAVNYDPQKRTYLRITDINDDGTLNLSDRKSVEGENLEKYILKENDIVFARTGASTGRNYFYEKADGEFVFAGFLIKFSIDPRKVNPRFVKYYCLSQEYAGWIQSFSTGSTRGNINAQTLANMELRLPPRDYQNRAVEILSSIDKKIAENRAINHNLLQQAKAIFDEWFIKIPQSTQDTLKITPLGYFPDSFSVVKTGELPIVVADYVANGSFASLKENVKLYQSKNYAYFIRNTDLKSGSFEVFVDKHSYDFLSKSRLFGGEIIISNVGDVGSVFLCPTLDAPMTLGNNIIMIKSDIPELRLFLYIWFKWSLGQGLIQGIKSGSAQPKFNKTDFKNLPIILPPSELLQKFNSTVSPIFEMIERNDNENRKLSSLRDSILPKLMSGEIDVSEVEV